MARSALKNISRLITQASTEVPVEKSFLADLKRSIELTDEKNRRLPSQTYKPSSMKCIRNMYYQVIGQSYDEGDSNYSLVGICNSGSDIHERIQQAVLDMKSNDMDCEYVNVADYVRNRGLDYLEIKKEPDPEHGDYETKLYHKDLNISFLCDGIIKYKGHYYILELKTESSYKWTSRSYVDENHYAQGTAYSIAFGIPEVIFVYITRDVLDMKAYKFVPTDEMKQALIDKIHVCDGYVASHTLPPKPIDASAKMCTYCSYRTSCNQDAQNL